MSKELVRTSSTVGESNLHLQVTPAYRRDIFSDSNVKDLVRIFIHDKLKQLGVTILAEDCGPDHWHFFLANWKHYSIEKIAQYVKGYSSYMIRTHYNHLIKHKLWGNKFWSEGYFYRTVGVVTKETMQHYIEETQSKHWTTHKNKQTTLLYFN